MIVSSSMDPSPVAVEASALSPLRGRTALTEAAEDIFYGSVCSPLSSSLDQPSYC